MPKQVEQQNSPCKLARCKDFISWFFKTLALFGRHNSIIRSLSKGKKVPPDELNIRKKGKENIKGFEPEMIKN